MLERRLTMHHRWRQWSGGIDLDHVRLRSRTVPRRQSNRADGRRESEETWRPLEHFGR
jgi:hypothetical protein